MNIDKFKELIDSCFVAKKIKLPDKNKQFILFLCEK